MNENFSFTQSPITSKKWTLAHVYLLALSDSPGIGLVRLRQCTNYLPTLTNDNDAYQLFQEIRNQHIKVIPEMEFKDFVHKVQVAKNELEALEQTGVHFVSFEDSFYRKLFANALDAPLHKGISLVSADSINEFSKKKVTKFAQYISERGWNSIFSLDAYPLIDSEFISHSAQSFSPGTTSLWIQNAPLSTSLQNRQLLDAITEGQGCLMGFSIVGGEAKTPSWAISMSLQITLSKGVFAFGYPTDETPYSKSHQKSYYGLIRSSGKRVICYQCDEKQMLDPNYADFARNISLLQDDKLLSNNRIFPLYKPRDIDVFLNQCLEG